MAGQRPDQGPPEAYNPGGASVISPTRGGRQNSPSQLSNEQRAYLAGITNYTGTPQQQAQLVAWQRAEDQRAMSAQADIAQQVWRNPQAVVPGADRSQNYLGQSADGRNTVAYAADPMKLADSAFQFSNYDDQLRLTQDVSDASRRAANDFGRRSDAMNFEGSRGMLASSLAQEGPSAAMSQLRAGQEGAARQALSLGQSGRGYGSAGAMREAAFRAAETTGNAAGQAAQLRAQEAQQRTANLAGLAGIDAQARAQTDQGQQAARAMQLGALGQYGATTQAQQQAFGDQAKTQMSAQMGTDLQNASFSNYRDPVRDNAGAIAGAVSGLAGAAATALSDIRAKRDIRPLPGMNEKTDSGRRGGLTDASRATGLAAGKAAGESSEATQLASHLGQARGQAGQSAAQALAQAPGYGYRYKPGIGEDPNAERFGPMAQDLEATPIGASAVETGPDGMKMVDTGRLALIGAAATGENTRQLDEIQRRLDELSGKGRESLGQTTYAESEGRRLLTEKERQSRGLAGVAR